MRHQPSSRDDRKAQHHSDEVGYELMAELAERMERRRRKREQPAAPGMFRRDDDEVWTTPFPVFRRGG
jgi:hypothetical protein